MTTPGVIRQPGPKAGYEGAPLWIRTVLINPQVFGDFITDMVRSIQRCDSAVADFLDAGEMDKARKMLGKREALNEMRFMVEAYRREEEEKNARIR